MGDFESPDELWIPKSRRTFATNGVVSFSTASMLTVKGWKGAGQAQNEDKSRELSERIAYQLRNLKGPFEGLLKEGKDWDERGRRVWVHGISALGIELHTAFEALPVGAAQWRAPGLTLGVLDEFSWNAYASPSYAAALACVQPFGKLVIIFTGNFDSYANIETAAMLKRARPIEEFPRLWQPKHGSDASQRASGADGIREPTGS